MNLGLTLPAVLLVMAEVATPPAPKPKRKAPAPAAAVTFDTVLSGKSAVGRSVEIMAILIPPSAIQTTARGQTRHFVLAVKKDSTYLKELAELGRELREQGLSNAEELGTAARDDTRFRTLAREVAELLDRATGAGTPRLARVPVAEALVVEVANLESLAKTYDWETVVDHRPGSSAEIAAKPTLSLPLPSGPWVEATARRDLLNASLLHPPDTSRPLPDLPAGARFETDREVESFNAAVALFNSELQRRRLHLSRRAVEDVRFHLERVERFLALEEQPLLATVVARVDIAAETYSQVHGAAPAVFLKERARGESAFVRRAFRTTTVLLTSAPSGALVTRDGAELGPTPLVLRDEAVGSQLRVALSLPGRRTKLVEETVAAQPMGVVRIDAVLETAGAAPTRPMTEEEGRRIFTAEFRPTRKIALAVFATCEQPGFKGKKDKDATKHAEALRKAALAGGFFDLTASPERAEVSLEIAPPEAEQSKESRDSRLFRYAYRSESEPELFSESLGLKDERSTASRVLSRISERLKSREWTRLLDVQ